MKVLGKLNATHFLVEDAYGGFWALDILHPYQDPVPCYPLYDSLEVDFAYAA